MAIIKWTPLNEMYSLSNALNRMFEESIWGGPNPTPLMSSMRQMAIDIKENKNNYEVKTALPGIKPEDVEIHITESCMLSIKAESKSEKETKDDNNYLVKECYSGSYFRQVQLPPNIQTDKVEANFEHGNLTIVLPKKAEALPKKIAIKATAKSIATAKPVTTPKIAAAKKNPAKKVVKGKK